MAVKIGSARIDENGRAHGGAAGDQTGKEVSTQSWYKHAKGWRVFRAKDPRVAEKIAQDMQWACDNKNIGYDQYQRDTLFTVSKPLGFNCKSVATKCETDCSALVRVCVNYAGISVGNFRTTDEAKKLLDTGAFVELTGSKYTDQSAYLGRGDILCTRTQGHTVVVLSNGSKYEKDAPPAGSAPGELRRGDAGEDVRAMQRALLAWDAGCLPRWGADGDFGEETEAAVRACQQAAGLTVTGVYDEATREALAAVGKARQVEATGDVNVRAAPGTASRILGVLKKGQTAPYQGEKSVVDGRDWYLVEFGGKSGWVSGKYAEVGQDNDLG